MMRSTPKIRLSPQATRPYTPPRSSPLTTAWRSSPQVTSPPGRVNRFARERVAQKGPAGPFSAARLALPLEDGEDRLRLGVLCGADHHRLAVLHLDQSGCRVDVLPCLV